MIRKFDLPRLVVPHRRKIPLFCLVFLAAIGGATTALAESLVVDADRQFQFAEQLFTEKKYSRAIGEYERFIYFFPDDERIPQARYMIGLAYFNSEKYQEAITAFRELVDTDSGKPFSLKSPITRAYFKISEAYLKLNAPGQASATLRNLVLLTENSAVEDEALYRTGWIFLEAGAWDRSAAFFEQISEESRQEYRLQTLSQEMNRVEDIPRKNPTLAGVLSIIPGAGYLYGERYRDALTAFLLNGGLMASAYLAFDNENPALGAVISFVELGFYTGQFYGAVSSVHKYNRDQTHRFIDQLKRNTRVGFSTGPRGDGLALSFRCDF
ncbi:MAG: tetratricopeptide repeat protein [Desulfococcaceae bacterium]